MQLRSVTTPNAILHLPRRPPNRDDSGQIQLPPLYFFVTGNPGLVSYYKEYLELLAGTTPLKSSPSSSSDDGEGDDSRRQSPQQHETSTDTREDIKGDSNPESKTHRLTTEDCVIAAFSLGGFEIENKIAKAKLSASLSSKKMTTDGRKPPSSVSDTSPASDEVSDDEYVQSLLYPSTYPRKQLYGLQDQIELCYARLRNLCRLILEHYGYISGSEYGNEHQNNNEHPSLKVIITGHSVGTYITLELTRLHYEYTRQQQRRSQPESNSSNNINNDTVNFDIIAAHLLTPTIIDLAKSPSGSVADPIVSNIPLFPSMVQFFSNRLVHTFFSRSYVEWMINKATGMGLNSPGLQTTVAFLMSKQGVKQALYLARDELRDMAENKWGAEVWGVERKKVEPHDDHVGDNQEYTETTSNGDVDDTKNDTRRPGGVGPERPWQAPRLFLLFAAWDGYISGATKEKILDTIEENERLKMEIGDRVGSYDPSRRPVVVVDEAGGMVHAWCLEHNDRVARVSREWTEDVLNT